MARKRRRRDPQQMAAQYKQDSTSGKYMKIDSGQTVVVRVLPPWEESSDRWYLKQLLHYGFKDLEDPNQGRTVPCLEYHSDEPCPVCMVTDWLFSNKHEKGYEALAHELKPKKRFLLNVLQKLDEERYGFSILGTGPMVMNQLEGFLSKPGYGDITDEEEGWWMYIQKTGTGFNTSYSVDPVPRGQGPIPVKDWDTRLYNLSDEVPSIGYEEAYQMLINKIGQDHPTLVESVCPHPSTIERATARRQGPSAASNNKKKATKKKVTKKAPARKKAARG